MKHAGIHPRARLAGLLALVVLTLLPGCGNESRPSRPGTAGLQIHLVFSDKTAAGTAGTTSVQTIRVSAWELPADDAPRVLRGREATTIAPGDTRFRLELQVPPAALYLLLVEAEGTLGSPPNPTGNGLLFLGSENIADVVAGENPPVEITLHRTVPVLQGQVVPTGLSLQWSRIEGALGYRLLETLPPPALPRETFTLRNDTLIIFPPHAKPTAPEPRAYRVRAELPDNLVSAFSESVGVSVPEPVAPAPIEDLVVVGADTAEIRLEWTATGDDQRVGRAREYDLRRSGSPITTEDAFAAAVQIGGVPAPQTSGQRERFTVTGLLPATDYFFAIKAADDVPLRSPLSNTALGTTLPLPPAAPQGLAAEALSDTAIRLHWIDRATNEALYRIERQSPTDPQFVLADTMIGSFTGTVEYQDHNLTERTSYRYRVRAENAAGVSAWSNEISQRTKVARPTNLTATAVAPDSVVLAWSFPLPHPADGFRLERRSGSAGFFEIAQPAAADRAFGDGGVQPLTTYAYRLRAADAGDLSDPSDSVEVTTSDLPPVCRVEPAALDFDTVSVGSSLDRTLTITNIGGGTLSGSVGASCANYSIVNGGGPFSLGAGQPHVVTIRFTPSVEQPPGCTVTLGATGCSSVSCTGAGETPPICSLNPTSLDFGIVPIGTDSVRTFTITNIGGGTLSGSVGESCAYYSIVTGGGAFSLGAGQPRVVTIRFTPQSTAPSSCPVTLGATGCSSVTCTGTGESLPLCSVNPTSLDFGTVPIGTDSVQTFTITNIGGGTLSGSVGASCANYSIVTGGGAFSLGAGQPRVVTIRFTPQSTAPSSCPVTLGTTGCSSVTCTGAGEGLPLCSVNPTSLDFGTVPIGTDSVRAFTITNIGGGTLSGSVGESCTYYSIVTGGGAFSLGAGQLRVVTIRFTPSVEQPPGCTVTLGATGCSSVSCTGAGQGPVCSVSPTSLDFGTIQVGESVSRTFTVTNTGGGHLTGTIFLTCPYFSLNTGGGVYDLGLGQTRDVTVVYTPSAPGSHDCRVETGCTDGVTCAGVATDPNEHWWPGFSGNAPNGPVKTLALHGSNLAVGGNITAVGNSPTDFLAWWTGSSWTTNIDPMWTDVHVLHTWDGPQGNGSLVAAGYAIDTPGITVAELVDGSWQFLVEQFGGGFVRVLATWQDNLYAGGSFVTPVSQLGYAYSDGWIAAGSGFAGNSVNDLEVFGEALYAAESFISLTGAGSGAIYRLDGSSWTPVTSTLGLLPLVSAQKLVTHAGALYAIVATSAGSYVARLQGTELVQVGKASGALGYFADLASDGDRLYAVGTFDEIDGVAASRVAAWDGSTWKALGYGITGGPASPTVILPFGGSIYVGGDFTTAGDKNSPNIARWIP